MPVSGCGFFQLSAPIELNRYVSLAPLPKQNAGLLAGRVCQVSGWGSISHSGGLTPLTLRTVKLPIVSTSKCNSSNSFSGNITTNMICAGSSTGGKDACKVKWKNTSGNGQLTFSVTHDSNAL